MLSMADNYQLLRYLYASKPDRQYPYWTPDEETSDHEAPEPLTGTDLVLPTLNDNYEGIDFIELLITHKEESLNTSEITLVFSSLPDASFHNFEFKCNVTEDIPAGEPYLVKFIVDNNKQMGDGSRKLTGISSLKVMFDKEVSNLVFNDLVFKSEDYTYTLFALEEFYKDGVNYVLRALQSKDIESSDDWVLEEMLKKVPTVLKRYTYMAGSAFAWLEHWEYEAKPMKQTNNESNNYADRLLGQVDKAIDNYLKTLDKNPDEIYIENLNLVTYDKLEWGL